MEKNRNIDARFQVEFGSPLYKIVKCQPLDETQHYAVNPSVPPISTHVRRKVKIEKGKGEKKGKWKMASA